MFFNGLWIGMLLVEFAVMAGVVAVLGTFVGAWLLAGGDRNGLWILCGSVFVIAIDGYLYWRTTDHATLHNLSLSMTGRASEETALRAWPAQCQSDIRMCFVADVFDVQLLSPGSSPVTVKRAEVTYRVDGSKITEIDLSPRGNVTQSRALSALDAVVGAVGGVDALNAGSGERYRAIRTALTGDGNIGLLAGEGMCAARDGYSFCVRLSSYGGRYGITYELLYQGSVGKLKIPKTKYESHR